MSRADLSACLGLIPAAGSSRRMAHLTRQRPKSLIEVGGRPILMHSLDVLASRGLSRAVIVTGYHGELLRETIGDRVGGLRLDYVHCHDYASTEHGWSLYQTRDIWQAEPRPVLLLDADNLYDPAIIDDLMTLPDDSVVTVDSGFVAVDGDEELVAGRNGHITALVRGRSRDVADCVGGFVGINRFSAHFCTQLFAFMQTLFDNEGRGFKYERVFDRLLRSGTGPLAYHDCAGRPWVNLNHESDLPLARQVAALMARGPGC